MKWAEVPVIEHKLYAVELHDDQTISDAIDIVKEASLGPVEILHMTCRIADTEDQIDLIKTYADAILELK